MPVEGGRRWRLAKGTITILEAPRINYLIEVCLDLESRTHIIFKYKHHLPMPAHLASILYDNVIFIYFVPLLAHTAEKLILISVNTGQGYSGNTIPCGCMQLISPAKEGGRYVI